MALRGVPGDIFVMGRVFDDEKPPESQTCKLSINGLAAAAYFHPAELEMAEKILVVATDYAWISDYVEQNMIGMD